MCHSSTLLQIADDRFSNFKKCKRLMASVVIALTRTNHKQLIGNRPNAVPYLVISFHEKLYIYET